MCVCVCAVSGSRAGGWGILIFKVELKLEVGHRSLLLSRKVIFRNCELGIMHIMAIHEAQGSEEFALAWLELECKGQVEENNLRNEAKADIAEQARKVICDRCHRTKCNREFIKQRSLSHFCAIAYPFWVIGQLTSLLQHVSSSIHLKTWCK